jgi:hypothetical protein
MLIMAQMFVPFLTLNKLSFSLMAAHLKAAHIKYQKRPVRLLNVVRHEYRITSGTVLFDAVVKK